MDELNRRVYLVDREDQVKWYLQDPAEASIFCVQLKDNHYTIRNWIECMTQYPVVISAQGRMPRIGTSDHAYHGLLEYVQKDQYKIYFEDENDAMKFKLAWGGCL